MMPAPAQVAATFSTDIEPPCRALMNPESVRFLQNGFLSNRNSAVSHRRKLVTKATTVAQNTDSSGEKPISMKAMIEISDRKWNQYFFDRLQALSTAAKLT